MKYGNRVYVGELFPDLFNVVDRKQGAMFDGKDVYGVSGIKLSVSKYGTVFCGPTSWDRESLSVKNDLIPAYDRYIAEQTYYCGNKTRGKNQPKKETPIQVAERLERQLAESQNKMRDVKFTILQTIKDLRDQIEILEEIYNDI